MLKGPSLERRVWYHARLTYAYSTPVSIAMYLFVDQLTNVDFSYLDVERGIVGETWLANFGLGGSLDQTGMICDFGAVKSQFRHWLDENLDHRLVVPVNSPALSYSIANGQINLEWQSQKGVIEMSAPTQAVALIPAETITPEACARWVIDAVTDLMPAQVSKIDLEFTTEAITGSFYHYTHGLKKHHGNCQRIAHGHRSTIALWRDGTRASDLEQQWCDQWCDIYVASMEDIQEQSESHILFGYNAPQGDFTLKLPRALCYLIETETTVENIAMHIHSMIKQRHPNNHIKVKAYEGFGKGAIAEDA